MQMLVGVVDPEVPGNVLKPRADGRMPVEIEGAEVTLEADVVVMGPVQLEGGTGNLVEVTLAGALKTDGSATTQPISAAALPLPAGASTAAAQSAGNVIAQAIADNTDQIENTLVLANGFLASIDTALAGPLLSAQSGAWSVSISGTVAVTQSGAWSVGITGSVAVTGPLTDAQLRAVAVPISVASLPLPAGAATSANQTSEIALLTTIDADTGNLDVALSTRLKPADTLAGVTLVSAVTSITNPVAASQSGAWSISITGSVAVTGTFWQSTQPVSIAASVAVTGPLTDAELRATPVPVSGTVAVTQGGAFTVSTDGLTDAELRASPVEITGAISATSAATATEESPTYTEGTPEALSQDLAGNLRTLISAIVESAPQSPIEGTAAPLSLTKQGRLRVAMVQEDLGVNFTNLEEASMWGNLKTDYTFRGSPWGNW